MSDHPKDAGRVAAGLKAAVHNPNVSAEAKERAIERLKEMQDLDSTSEQQAPTVAEESPRVLAGYKATLSNPYTSQEAKERAEEVLVAAGILERNPNHSDEQHNSRVLAGYKAALANPRVSADAKQHAREYLQQHGVDV